MSVHWVVTVQLQQSVEHEFISQVQQLEVRILRSNT
jgi:hypothetical protein